MTITTSSKWGGVEGRVALAELAQNLTRTAKRLLEEGKDVVPLVAVCNDSHEVVLIPVTWDEGHKREVYDVVRQYAKDELHMEAAILVNDSWMAKVPKEWSWNPSMPAVRDMPQRVEALVVTVLGPNWRESITMPYERHASGVSWHDEVRTNEFTNELFSL